MKIKILGVLLFTTFTSLNGNNLDEKNDEHVSKYIVYSEKCKIPYIEPWSAEIPYIFSPQPYIHCTDKSLLTKMTVIENRAIITLIKENIPQYSYYGVRCCYRKVQRLPILWPEDHLLVGSCKYFDDSATLFETQEGYIAAFVKCMDFATNMKVYDNVHVAITINDDVQKKMYQHDRRPNPQKISLLLIGIDSVSRLNMMRAMPKTYDYLKRNEWFEMRGYNKIGENTFPNWMGMLAGMNLSRSEETCKPTSVGGMDNCSLIWYDFAGNDYITAYAEDESSITTFNYLKKGFYRKPTDYYYRPYIMASERFLKVVEEHGLSYCTGPETSGERIMNMAKDFAKKFKKHPYYGFFWTNTFSHNHLETPSRMDEKVRDFLADISKDDTLNNTITFFISDHGVRFGEILKTKTGWFELSLPFFFVKVPDWFRTSYPEKYINLKLNEDRLTTPYDFFMTAQEMIQWGNKNFVVRQAEACPMCKSLFSEVERVRSCSDASIAENWCTCREFDSIPISSYIKNDNSSIHDPEETPNVLQR